MVLNPDLWREIHTWLPKHDILVLRYVARCCSAELLHYPLLPLAKECLCKTPFPVGGHYTHDIPVHMITKRLERGNFHFDHSRFIIGGCSDNAVDAASYWHRIATCFVEFCRIGGRSQ